MSQPANDPVSRASSGRKLRFGTFEVDLRNRELRNRGMRIRLQEKPFQVLELLLQRSGDLVTREELSHHLWPGLHVNFDRSLNTAVNSLRGALGDSSRGIRFIETRSGLGYRFVAHVEEIPETLDSPSAVLSPIDPEKFDAYEDYLKGRYFYGKMNEADLHKSVAHFESSIAQDPSYAPAYAGLADVYRLFAFFGMLCPLEAGSRSKDLAARALQMDDAAPEAHAAIAAVKASFDWDWSGSEMEYLRALELNPNYAEGHHGYAALLSRMGRAPEARKHIRRAQELNPLSLAICLGAGWILCVAQDFQAAVEQCWKLLAMDPAFAPAQCTLGLAYQCLGMLDEATTELENACSCSGNNPAMAASLAYAYAAGGRPDDAKAILRELEAISERRYVSAYWTSMVWTGLGVHDRALDELEKACEHRDVWLAWLSTDPRFHPIRRDPRFSRVLQRSGLS